MPQEQISNRHHYVPEFYLKRWADRSGQLVQFSKPHGNLVKPKRCHPKATGFLDKLYALEEVPDHLTHYFEVEFFKPVDTRAADVLRMMDAGVKTFTARERTSWGRFILSLLFRHPENVAATKQRLEADLWDITPAKELEYRQRRKPNQPLRLRDALALEKASPAITQTALKVLTSTSNSAKIGTRLINMKWGQLTLPFYAPALLTSDRPVIWAQGMADPDCHILLPTGPKTLFWAVNSGDMILRLNTIDPIGLVEFVNEQVTSRAVKYVWGFSDKHLGFVQANMGVNPQVTIPDMLVVERYPEAVTRKRRE
jgi:Protein of unknown function (DUF4238)